MAEPHVEPHARTCVERGREPLSGRGLDRVDLRALRPYGSRHDGADLSAVEPHIDVGPVGARQQDVVVRCRGRHPRLGRIGLGVRLLLGGRRGEFLLNAGLLATGPTSGGRCLDILYRVGTPRPDIPVTSRFGGIPGGGLPNRGGTPRSSTVRLRRRITPGQGGLGGAVDLLDDRGGDGGSRRRFGSVLARC